MSRVHRAAEVTATFAEVMRIRGERADPLAAYADAVARVVATASGRPAPPVRPDPNRCACGHSTLRHTERPGYGCTASGCLCLTPPSVILREAAA